MKISKGNNKIGRIANISMTPIKACKGCADICGKDCYAMKAYRKYNATREAWVLIVISVTYVGIHLIHWGIK